jgi:hypothetical protein
VTAGFNPGRDPDRLHLWAGGVEHAISVSDGGDGRFDAADTIAFYGTGNDTPYSGTHTYWLTRGDRGGLRIPRGRGTTGSPGLPTSRAASERRYRSLYLATLLDENHDGFVGPQVTAAGSTFALPVDTPLPGSPATLTVILRSIEPEDLAVNVALNGRPVADLVALSRSETSAVVPLDPSDLCDGDNAVTLRAVGEGTSRCFVEVIRVGYTKLLRAQAGVLRATVDPTETVEIAAFRSPEVRAFDVSDPARAVELDVRTRADGSSFTARVAPASLDPARTGSGAQLLVLDDDATLRPALLAANRPSRWNTSSNQADLVIVTHSSLAAAAERLGHIHRKQGARVAVVDVDDAYDEYSSGDKDPAAIRDLLARARRSWRGPPRWVLLLGDATFDPRNHLGLGEGDLVPTCARATESIRTASDDWFVDFDNTGVPDIAIGRIPARTLAEANAVIDKIERHLQSLPAQTRPGSVVLAADAVDARNGYDFAADLRSLEPVLSSSFTIEEIFSDSLGTDETRGRLAAAFGSGHSLLIFAGHGSPTTWGRVVLLSGAGIAALSPSRHPPVVIALTCLSGLFHDVYNESLGELLLEQPAGGAVAVLALSSLTQPEEQFALARALVAELGSGRSQTLGELLAAAKRLASDTNVRRSMILLGDPMLPVAGAPAYKRAEPGPASPDSTGAQPPRSQQANPHPEP